MSPSGTSTMTGVITIVIAVALAAVLCIVNLVQTLYREAMRIRTRELPILQFFRAHLEPRIAARGESGPLAYSIIKHTTLLLLTFAFLVIRFMYPAPLWENLLQAGALAWLTILLCSYVLPQLLFRKTEGHWLLALVPVLRVMTLLTLPFTALLGFFQSLVELAEPDAARDEPANSAEHVEALITAGTEEGIIEEEDRKLIQSVVAFGDKTVREVMTPRPKIVAIEAKRPLGDLREMVIEQQFSRIPVYEESIDNIVGFVHVRDIFELDDAERHTCTVRELARPIRHVPESKPVADLLREMQQDGVHMAVAVDEYGNTAGLATMEDMVEEILGEIHDEHEPDRDVTEESEGTFVISGATDLDRLEDLLHFRPLEETESTTVAGLVTEWLGHVPNAGESIEREGLRIEVLAANGLLVEQVRISRAVKVAQA